MRSDGLRRVTTIAAGLLLAAALAAVVVLWGERPAEAAFPGQNGKIVFSSNRTSGEGVDNPGGDSEIFTVNPNGTELTQLTHNSTDDEEPVYSADGRQIAFVGWRYEDWLNPDIYKMSAEGTNETRVTSDRLRYDLSPSWSPDGKHIAFEGAYFDGEFWSTQHIYKTSANGGKAVRLTKTTNSSGTDYHGPAWSPNGKRIAFIKDSPQRSDPWFREDIVLIKPRPVGPTNRPVRLVGGIGEYYGQPSWSPDGGQLLFDLGWYDSNDDFVGGIYTIDGDGKNRTPLTQDPNMGQPTWSPDGEKIAFTDFGGATNEVYTMDANGSNQVNLTNNAAYDSEPDWQPIVP